MSYESVRDFSLGFGLLLMGGTYLVAVAWTFRRRARAAHERAATMIFDEDHSLPEESGSGR